MKFKRVFLMVLDSVGVGEAQDASKYGDNGANTLGHIKEKCNLFISSIYHSTAASLTLPTNPRSFSDSASLSRVLTNQAYFLQCALPLSMKYISHSAILLYQ